jgi:hypothetical protein
MSARTRAHIQKAGLIQNSGNLWDGGQLQCKINPSCYTYGENDESLP